MALPQYKTVRPGDEVLVCLAAGGHRRVRLSGRIGRRNYAMKYRSDMQIRLPAIGGWASDSMVGFTDGTWASVSDLDILENHPDLIEA
jgi:hypothetical protein